MNKNNHPIIQEISKVLHGKEHIIKVVYASFLAQGHVLLEDVPGVGKTTLAHALAIAAGLPFNRLQCTNDLLPSDMLGASMWNHESKVFEFHKGPIFTNVLVADEINRAPSKSQSALLEAMEEGKISIEGQLFHLPDPFWVVATQNPQEHLGTNELPESQLDRFLIKISMGYPDEQSEKMMLRRPSNEKRGPALSKVDVDVQMDKEQSQQVTVADNVIDYIYRLVAATRTRFDLGLSPRAALGLVSLVKAWAWLHHRDYVTPSDVQIMLPYVANHRVVVSTTNASDGVAQLLKDIPVEL